MKQVGLNLLNKEMMVLKTLPLTISTGGSITQQDSARPLFVVLKYKAKTRL